MIFKEFILVKEINDNPKAVYELFIEITFLWRHNALKQERLLSIIRLVSKIYRPNSYSEKTDHYDEG